MVSSAVDVRRLPAGVVGMFLLVVIVVEVFAGHRCIAAAAASKLRRGVTQPPAAVYQGVVLSSFVAVCYHLLTLSLKSDV